MTDCLLLPQILHYFFPLAFHLDYLVHWARNEPRVTDILPLSSARFSSATRVSSQKHLIYVCYSHQSAHKIATVPSGSSNITE